MACDRPSRLPGAKLGVIGHGIRNRQLRGPPEPRQAPVERTIFVRRFLCLACGAVMTVVPQQVAPGRWYAAPAIVWALALFGVLGLRLWEIRALVQPDVTRPAGDRTPWRQVARWVARLAPPSDTRRERARAFALRCAATAGVNVPLDAEGAWAAAARGTWTWPGRT